METENSEQNTFSRKDSSNEDSKQKKENQQSNKQNTNTGFDINSLLNNPNLMEILKHLVSGGGAMAGNYFIWIKPLQDKIEAMNKKITEQEKQIKELQEDQRELLRNLHETDEPNSLNGKSQDYFNLKRDYSNSDYVKDKNRSKMRSKYV